MDLVDEEDDVALLPYLLYDLLNPVLEHAAEYRPGDDRVHLEVHYLLLPQSLRDGVGLQLNPARKPLDNRGLTDTRLPHDHDRIAPLHMIEDLDHLVDLALPSDNGRELVVVG